MYRGYVKTFRVLEDWALYKDSEAVHLLTHLMLKASHKDYKIDNHGKPLTIKAGQLKTGRKRLSMETGINSSKIQRLLTKFENFGEIEQQTNTKDRIITLLKWEQFQPDTEKRTTSEQQANNKRTTSEQQANTKQECKERKERKEEEFWSSHNSDSFKSAFKDFVSMRKQIKHEMTDKAIQLAISKLDKHDEQIAIKMLEASIMNSWKGLFDLKQDYSNTAPKRGYNYV